MERVIEYHQIYKARDLRLAFSGQLESIIESIRTSSLGKDIKFARFFLSDISNQFEQTRSLVKTLGDFPFSLIGQPPLDGSKICAWVYMTKGKCNPSYTHRWDCMMTSNQSSSKTQMEELFQNLESNLQNVGMTVKDNCIRTWIFARDIDTNYGGVVEGRRDYFNKIGLLPNTHYIASTGIQGDCPDYKNLVMMDAYSVSGLSDNQICYLKGSSHLNDTYEYGVTFERGTSVTYGDRKHIFISGTASIDNKGEILHKGNVINQASRMMENIETLLNEANALSDDIKVAIVYLRDSADYLSIKTFFEREYPYLNPIIVHAPVCRPGWLIEMECIASIEANRPEFKEF